MKVEQTIALASHFRWQLYSAVASLVNTGCFSGPIAGARKSVRLSRRTSWANDQTLNPGQEGMWTFRWKLIRPKLFLQFVYRLLLSTTDTALNFWFWWIGCHLSPLNLNSRWLVKLRRTVICLRQNLTYHPMTEKNWYFPAFGNQVSVWISHCQPGVWCPNQPAGCNKRLPLFHNMWCALRKYFWRDWTGSTRKRNKGQHIFIFLD